MYHFAICDDDIKFCTEFEKKLSSLPSAKSMQYELTCFHSGGELLAAMDNGRGFDLVFLDIVLNDGFGIDIARTMRERRLGCDIVFISAHKDFAFDSYEVRPLHYISKTPDFDRLDAAIDRFLEKSSGATIYLSAPRGAIALNLADVLYFEVLGHDLIIHKTDGTTYQYRSAMRKMENLLPAAAFVRTQRSFLVNLSYVREISRHEVIMANGEAVPIGRGMYNDIKLKFLDYVAKKNEFI